LHHQSTQLHLLRIKAGIFNNGVGVDSCSVKSIYFNTNTGKGEISIEHFLLSSSSAVLLDFNCRLTNIKYQQQTVDVSCYLNETEKANEQTKII